MNFDWPSFSLGATLGAVVGGFAKALGGEAGKFLVKKVTDRLNPPDVQVDGRFEATAFQAGDCAWVSTLKRYDYEADGWTYYPHLRGKAKCFRVTGGSQEYLMVRPNAASNIQ